ncbi:serine-rich adhesin for platelets-like [Palaemon carinicauda]|uniref:serine-rich adhesin for platelets-like n=1 Tax=Palaemon carinicauda TaxID=392227 RepID=UPI0035B589FE
MVSVTDSAALATPLSSIVPPSPTDEYVTLSVLTNRSSTNITEDGNKDQLNPNTSESLTTEKNEFESLQVSDDLKLTSHKDKSPVETQTQTDERENREESNKTGLLEVQTQRPRALEETRNPGLLTWSWIGGSTKPVESTPANWEVAEKISLVDSSMKLTTLFPNISSSHIGNDNTNTDDEYDKDPTTNQQSVVQSMNTDLFRKESVSDTNVSTIHYSTNFANSDGYSQIGYVNGNKEPVKDSDTGNLSNRDLIGYQVNIHRDNSSSGIYGKMPLFSVQQAEIIVHDRLKNTSKVQIYNQMHPPLLHNNSPNNSHDLEQSNSFNSQWAEKPILSGPPKQENNANIVKYDILPHSMSPSTPSSSEIGDKFVKFDLPHFVEKTNVDLGPGSGTVDEIEKDLPPSVLSNMLKYFNNFYANSSDTSSESYGHVPSPGYYFPNHVKFDQSTPEYNNQHRLGTYTVNNSTKMVQETFENFSQLPDHFNVANDSYGSKISSHTNPTTTAMSLSMVNPNVIIKISEQLMDTKRPMLGSSQSLFKNSTQSHQPERSEIEDSQNSEIRPTVAYELISSSNYSYEELFDKTKPSLAILNTTPKYEEHTNVPETSQNNSVKTALLIKPDPTERDSPVISDLPETLNVTIENVLESSQNNSFKTAPLIKPDPVKTDSPVISDLPQILNATTEGSAELAWLPLTLFTKANEIGNTTDESQILALNQKSNISDNIPSSDVSHSDTNAVLTYHSGSGILNQTITSQTNILDDFMTYLLSMDSPISSEQTTLEPLSQKLSNIPLDFTQNRDDDVLHNSTSFSPMQSLDSTSNSTSEESSMVSDLEILKYNQTDLEAQDSEAPFLDTFDQSHGNINSWSLLESLVNNSGYTPPTLNIDCEIYGPLSPIVDFYGNLFPGLENPCKNTSQKERKDTENKVVNEGEEVYLVTSTLPNHNISSEEITTATLVPSSPDFPENVFASKVNHDSLSSFTDFSADILNKTFASLFDEASSELKNAYPIKHLTMPSETQIKKWWEPLKEITAAPVLENIASVISVNMPVFNDESSTHSTMEKHSSDNISIRLPSFTSEQVTESPQASAVTVHASNTLSYEVLPNASLSHLFTNITKDINQELKNLVTTESSLSTALSIVGYKALPTVTMSPGGGSTIIVKSKMPESEPPEVHIPNPF